MAGICCEISVVFISHKTKHDKSTNDSAKTGGIFHSLADTDADADRQVQIDTDRNGDMQTDRYNQIQMQRVNFAPPPLLSLMFSGIAIYCPCPRSRPIAPGGGMAPGHRHRCDRCTDWRYGTLRTDKMDRGDDQTPMLGTLPAS